MDDAGPAEGAAVTALVWSGAALALVGVALLLRLVLTARRMRGETLTPEESQARLQTLVMLNFAGLGVGLLGLGLLLAGLLIGA